MNFKRVKTIMAYFIMPLFFSLIGIGIVILLFSPFLKSAISTGNAITGNVNTRSNKVYQLYDEELAIKTANTIEEMNLENIELSDVSMPTNSTQYGKIYCDRVGFLAPLFFGDDSNILRLGVGQYIGSSMPGFGKPILLCGHNTSYCLPMQYMEVGDVLCISTNYGLFEYTIDDLKVLNMSDPTAFNLNKNEEELILYTCYPFDLIGAKTDRLFIYAKKTNGPSVSY